MKIWSILIVIFISLMSCGSPDPTDPQANSHGADGNEPDNHEGISRDHLADTDFNILFVGNSLTYANDLPTLVRDEAKAKNGLTIGVTSIANGNYAIIDHWEDGLVQEEIKTGLYDFVVVQQGPSSQSFGRQVLIEYGAKYKALCTDHEAALAFYMVWPALDYFHTFDGVIKNYGDAAALNESILCPVGSVWKQYIQDTEDLSYYGSDGFHPSLKGSEVAAEVIVETLFE